MIKMNVKFDDSGFKKLKRQVEELKSEIEDTKVYANSEEELHKAAKEKVEELFKKHFNK